MNNPNFFTNDHTNDSIKYRNHDPNKCAFCYNEQSIEYQHLLETKQNEVDKSKIFDDIHTAVYSNESLKFSDLTRKNTTNIIDEARRKKAAKDAAIENEKTANKNTTNGNNLIKNEHHVRFAIDDEEPMEIDANPELLKSPNYSFDPDRDKKLISEPKRKSTLPDLSQFECETLDIPKFNLQFNSIDDEDSLSDPISEFLNEYESMDEDEDSDLDDVYDHEVTHNLLMTHPFFNQNNPVYIEAIEYYRLFTQQSIDDINTLFLPQQMVDVPLISPENPNETMNIHAAADTGSQIQAMGHKMSVYYKNKGLLKTHSKGIMVGTGNGKIHVKEYLPVSIKGVDGKIYSVKFWSLPSLPSFDWLIGGGLLKKLGWELTNTYYEYHHVPKSFCDGDEELDQLLCSQYPIDGEPDIAGIDVSKVAVSDDYLRPIIHDYLRKYKQVIAQNEFDSGFIHSFKYEIPFIEEEHPMKDGFLSKEYWMNDENKAEVRGQLNGLLKSKKVRECRFPRWVSSLFCVPKKTGDVRIVFDFRKLNLICKKLKRPIPDTRKLLRKFKDKTHITSLDLKGGYWHIPIAEDHKSRTAFIFDGKIYEWNVLPFGLTNAPMFFQQAMDEIFGHLPFVTIYLDDISILSDSAEQHKEHLGEVFKILCKHHL